MDTDTDSWFLSDDLSGALEVGAAWYRAGHRVDVGFDTQGRQGDGTIYGLSSETRNESQKFARERIARIIGEAGKGNLMFKKIDSTLRGPIGVELKAITDCFSDRPILFSPSHPVAGRTVEGGKLFVKGRPVSQTSFSVDPTSPIVEDRISRLIESSGGPKSVEIELTPSKAEVSEMSDKLQKGWQSSPVAIVDANTESDLAKWVKAARMASSSFLPCGSGGLARAIEAQGLLPAKDNDHKCLEKRRGRVLFVVGSVHPVSRSQMEFGRTHLNIPIESLSTEVVNAEDWQAVAERIGLCLEKKKAVGLVTELPREPRSIGRESTRSTADLIGKISSSVFKKGVVDTVFVTGGETARAFLDAIGCRYLSLSGDLGPGVAVAKILGTAEDGATLIVKPGGFGEVDLFARVLKDFGYPRDKGIK